jgi:hypothetical protein
MTAISIDFQEKKLVHLNIKKILTTHKNVVKRKPIKLFRTILFNKTSSLNSKVIKIKKINLTTIIL